MQLKLAEYKNGKFKRFLELGEDFAYAGNLIGIYDPNLNSLLYSPEKRQFLFNHLREYEKDEKDPLNRFDGLFDGRTYGNGRFVLIENDEHDIFENHYFLLPDGNEKTYYILGAHKNLRSHKAKSVGNLHENPELWEKVK